MTDKHSLICFLAVIAAIVALSLIGKADLAVVTGLVGIAGTFRPSRNGPSGTPADPVSVEPQ